MIRINKEQLKRDRKNKISLFSFVIFLILVIAIISYYAWNSSDKTSVFLIVMKELIIIIMLLYYVFWMQKRYNIFVSTNMMGGAPDFIKLNKSNNKSTWNQSYFKFILGFLLLIILMFVVWIINNLAVVALIFISLIFLFWRAKFIPRTK